MTSDIFSDTLCAMRICSVMILFSLLVGCRDLVENDDTAVAVVDSFSHRVGCSNFSSPFIGVEMVDSPSALIPRLDWVAEEPLTPILVVETEDGRHRETPGESAPSEQGSVYVFGAPAQQSAQALLAVDTEEGRFCSQAFTYQMASLSTAVPEITLSSYDPSQAEGGFTLAHLITEVDHFVVIFDELGRFVWNLNVGEKGGIARVVAGLDRQSILHLRWAPTAEVDGYIYRRGLDGSLLEEIPVLGIHTDFVELPDGRYGGLGWEVRSTTNAEGITRYLLADTLLIISASGQTEVLWSAFEHFEKQDSIFESEAGQTIEAPLDWSHANGLDYSVEEDAFFITLAGVNSVVRVAAETGEQVWRLSMENGDFDIHDPVVWGPHSVQSLGEDRILLFNRNLSQNGELPDEAERCSEAREIALYPEEREVETIWTYGSDDCLWVLYFGEAHRLEGGNTQVIFSSLGQIDEATPLGETVWRINTDVGAALGFGDRVSRFRLDSIDPQ